MIQNYGNKLIRLNNSKNDENIDYSTNSGITSVFVCSSICIIT